MLGTTPATLGTTPAMLGTTPAMLGTTPAMLGTTLAMLGTTLAMLGTTPTIARYYPYLPCPPLRPPPGAIGAPHCPSPAPTGSTHYQGSR